VNSERFEAQKAEGITMIGKYVVASIIVTTIPLRAWQELLKK
jgi:hypothetical protein